MGPALKQLFETVKQNQISDDADVLVGPAMMRKLLCAIGLHRWKMIHRPFEEYRLYWALHGKLPDDFIVCEYCGKKRMAQP